ncbi:TauD/TfdA dioxygenase family protein [Novosphingobium album (ex Hu et al. 2023)]|uniref:TauD/TfdA family dioxygenase n=1 Tax=Novosphingobium album (ex Hu et al. 2023) TaxID=2930093 RepID=A0ABT0AWD5_9SPHN|nr:TauD/TfdA family dioxygenase [Novosphingobium album (ex Hu et al. 2023)]MCJ2177081.1 TauD/TfdA family dioxygenase [Novosphingobium album (ex Hu et al. 2023)]
MTEVIEKTALKFERIKPKVGARILNSKEELLSGELSQAIRELLEDAGVLVFPAINFTDEEQIAFTNSVGGNATELRGEQVFKISLDKDVNQEAVEYLKGSLFWHVDGTMNPMPIRGSVLSSKVLPTWGGNTEFANCYTAYDDLPQETKDRIENMRVIHSLWNSQLYHCPEPTLAQLEDWMGKGEDGTGERELPLVYKHPSGRKSLILGNTAERVVGLSSRESAKLLHGLREHAISEPYHYVHEWTLGDAVMWDNTGSLHRAMPYDPDCGRMLHRTIIKGESWG